MGGGGKGMKLVTCEKQLKVCSHLLASDIETPEYNSSSMFKPLTCAENNLIVFSRNPFSQPSERPSHLLETIESSWKDILSVLVT